MFLTFNLHSFLFDFYFENNKYAETIVMSHYFSKCYITYMMIAISRLREINQEINTIVSRAPSYARGAAPRQQCLFYAKRRIGRSFDYRISI